MLGTYHRLNVHVNASNIEVIRQARKKIAENHKNSRDRKDARKSFYRSMLDYHRKAQDLCLAFRL